MAIANRRTLRRPPAAIRRPGFLREEAGAARGRLLLDRQARRYLGMSGAEFAED